MAQREMPGRTTTAAPAPAELSANPDWPAQTADTIERIVGSVRDKTTGPAISVARSAVYGTLAGIIGIAVLVMLAVAAVRALDIGAREALGEESTWLAHLVVGVIFCLGGMLLWSKRRQPDER